MTFTVLMRKPLHEKDCATAYMIESYHFRGANKFIACQKPELVFISISTGYPQHLHQPQLRHYRFRLIREHTPTMTG